MMSTAVRDVSIDCYHGQVAGKLKEHQQQRILEAMRQGRDYSSSELCVLTGIKESTMSPRVNELRADGFIEIAPKRKCSVTGATITPSRLPSPVIWSGLFW